MGVPGAWAQALLLLLLVAVATEAQNSVCILEQLIYKVTENDTKALNQPLANITADPGIDVVLTSESMEYFKIQAQDQGQGQDLFLKKVPDFEVQPILLANMECRNGDVVVGKLTMVLEVLDVNDNAPEFPKTIYRETVSEDTKVGDIVIPASELQATDKDLNDVLYYTLEEVTLNASRFFSLLSRIQPGLKLKQRLNYYELPSMTFRLVVHDTEGDSQVPRHSAEATVVVEVKPADLRPPWFLPCVYNDSNTCIQAQYKTILPMNVPPPNPLKMSPGPIYAVDGDWAINEKIFYSLPNEGVNSMFSIDRETGNLTMRGSVDSPRTFQLVVKGTQESDARYSVTQVTVDVTSDKSHVSFPLSLYRGFVVLGQGANVAVKDSADPSQPLTLRARDITFPEYNGDFQYHITDNDHFYMEREAVLTTDQLVDPGVYTATVEANNTATQSSGSTKVEIRVLSPPTPPPGTNTNPTSSSGTSQATTSGTPGTGTATTTGTVTVTETGTVTSTVTTPGTLTTSRTVTAPGAVTTSGASGTVTAAPGKVTTSGIVTAAPGKVTTSGIMTAAPGTVTTTTSGTVTGTVTTPGTGTGTGTVPGGSEDGGGGDSGTHPESESLRFSAVHMAALGGVLGALLLVSLLALSVLVHKHYSHRIRCCCSRNSLKSQPEGYDNKTFAVDSEDNWAPAPSPAPSPAPVKKAPAPPTPPSTATPSPPGSPATPVAPATSEGGSPAAVRSILTKERRPEGGYKAVWFGEDIGAEADVVVLNSPTVDAQAGSDSERDSDHQGDSGSEDGAHGDATYI